MELALAINLNALVMGRFRPVAGGALVAPAETFKLVQTGTPGSFPLALTQYPNRLTRVGDQVTVRVSPTLVPWVPTILASFPSDSTQYNASAFGGALVKPGSGSGYYQEQIGSEYSQIIQYGVATAPAITSPTTFNLNELTTSFPLTLDIPAYIQWFGRDMGRLEVVGDQPGTSFIVRRLDGQPFDFDSDSAFERGFRPEHQLLIRATSRGGAKSNTLVTPTIIDVDEIPASFSFAPVTDVALSTVVASPTTIEITDLAAGVSVLATVSGPGTPQMRKRVGVGGVFDTWSSTPRTATNNDFFEVRNTSSASYSTPLDTTFAAGSVSAVFRNTTGLNPALVSYVASPSGAQYSGSGQAATKTFSAVFEVGRYTLFTFGNRPAGSASVANNGSCTLRDSSNATGVSIVIFEIDITVPGTQVITLNMVGGGSNLERIGVLPLKIVSAAAGDNGTVKKAVSFNGNQNATSALAVSTNGMSLTGVYFDSATDAVVANNATLIGTYVVGTTRFYLLQAFTTVTPGMSTTDFSGPPGCVLGISYNHA